MTGVATEEFKMTELGPLPPEWEVARLGELIEEVREKNQPNFQYPVFTISNICGFMLSDEFFDKRVYSKKLNTYKIVRSDYFAYNPYRVNVGSLALLDHEVGLVSPAYVVFRISKPQHLHPPFLYRLIKSPRYLDEIRRIAMSRGSVRRSLSFRDLSDFRIPLPSIPEQKKITNVLSTLQTAIEKTEVVIKANRELKKSLMKYLFTYGPVSIDEVENVPLKETEIGMVPEEWDVLKFEKIIRSGPQNGIYKHQNCYGDGTSIVRIDDYGNEGDIISRATSRVRLTPEEVEKYLLNTDDILINRVNSLTHLGKMALVGVLSEPAVFESNMMRLTVDQSLAIPEYALRFLTLPSSRDQMRGKSKRAVAQSSINQGDVRSLAFALPELAVQHKITNTLTALGEKIQSEENKRQTLEALFKTMLSRLMTGKIRVNNLEVPV